MKPVRHLLLSAALPALLSLSAHADDSYALAIKDHRFDPVELVVPAGQKVKLRILNRDGTPEEFESYELNREKIIPGGQEAVVFIGPLDAGRYPFFGDFNRDTANGVIIAK
jgi:hypothetical protein